MNIFQKLEYIQTQNAINKVEKQLLPDADTIQNSTQAVTSNSVNTVHISKHRSLAANSTELKIYLHIK